MAFANYNEPTEFDIAMLTAFHIKPEPVTETIHPEPTEQWFLANAARIRGLNHTIKRLTCDCQLIALWALVATIMAAWGWMRP